MTTLTAIARSMAATALAIAALLPATGSAADTGAREVVLVVGATGRSGPALIDALRSTGHTRLRALVRDVDSAKTKLGVDIELAQGDVRDPVSLAAAMRGVQYVVSALGSNDFADPANSPEHVDYEGVRNLAGAAKASGVAQYVQISAIGVTNPNHPLNRYGNVMLWKLKGEDAMRASGVPYTIVRPGGLLDEPGGKTGIVALQGDKSGPSRIPRADVAVVCARALGNPDALNKTFEIVTGEPGARVDWSTFFKSLVTDPRP